jgi:hypothetical protein
LLDAELALNHLADQVQGPQRKLKPMLLWVGVAHRARQPTQVLVLELRRTPRHRLGIERVLPALGKGRQPAIDSALVNAECRRHFSDGLAALDGTPRLHAHGLQ